MTPPPVSSPAQPQTAPPRKSLASACARYLRLVLWNLVGLAVILIVLEGLASYILLIRDVMTTYPIAERLHTQYDAELGWVNRPSADVPDMYGPGVYLRTNQEGFRGDHGFDRAIPEGKSRLICSGDSFTLGYGVDDDHTWCRLLTSIDPHLETINMGQGGYGIDQMFLWYKRDGLRFAHQVHLLVLISQDFTRMQSDTSAGYAKPVIDLEDGALVVKGVPVPRHAYRFSWLVGHLQNLERLRTWELLWRAKKKLGLMGEMAGVTSPADLNARTRQVLVKVFEELKHLNEERGSMLVFVFLPLEDEIRSEGPLEWMTFIEQESRDLGVPFINVLEGFRQLPDGRAGQMFIGRGQVRFQGAAGHLNNVGNEFVADLIYRKMKEEPRIARALSIR